jgi:hypothetical protein
LCIHSSSLLLHSVSRLHVQFRRPLPNYPKRKCRHIQIIKITRQLLLIYTVFSDSSSLSAHLLIFLSCSWNIVFLLLSPTSLSCLVHTTRPHVSFPSFDLRSRHASARLLLQLLSPLPYETEVKTFWIRQRVLTPTFLFPKETNKHPRSNILYCPISVTPFLSLLYLSLVKILLHCYKALATFFRSHAIHFTAVHCTFLFPKETKKNTREAIYCPLSVTPFLSLLYMSLVQIMLHCYKALATFFRSHAIQLTALHLKRQKKHPRSNILSIIRDPISFFALHVLGSK